ncbi:xylulokinase [Viridibacterium curvum]
MANYLGIDLGTSSLKALLLSDRHEVLDVAEVPLAVYTPHTGWSEQSAEDWWAACCEALDALASRQVAGMAAVRSIGLSGQMHGAVLLDDEDVVLRRAILWNDGRSAEDCAVLSRCLPDLPQIAGNLAMPGFTAPKLLWVAREEPAIFARTRSVLLPKDWLRLKLCGEKISDMSDAAGTLWLDVAKRDWSDELLQATGMQRAQMPQLVEGSAVGGILRPELAHRWGLRERLLMAGGAGDNAASAVGIGAVSPGDGFVSLGTSGVLFVCTPQYLSAPHSAVHAFCHALPGVWHQMGVILSAANCLRWVTGLLGRDSERALLDEVAMLDDTARQQAPIFLPYLNGERTPHNDAAASGVLFGLRSTHAPAAIGYAVIEGVAFALLDCLQALTNSGTAVGALGLVGGGARSAEWAQLLADVLEREIHVYADSAHAAAVGAARLAWLADGGNTLTVCLKPDVSARLVPNLENTGRLRGRHARFARLYAALKNEFDVENRKS